MPRRFLPDDERAICTRLHEFRSWLLLSRPRLASLIGFEKERIAALEGFRAPLRWDVYKRLGSTLGLNPRWLAIGEGLPRAPFARAFLDAPIAARTLFSTAFEAHGSLSILPHSASDEQTAEFLTHSVKELRNRLNAVITRNPSSLAVALSNAEFTAHFGDLQNSVARASAIAGIVQPLVSYAAFYLAESIGTEPSAQTESSLDYAERIVGSIMEENALTCHSSGDNLRAVTTDVPDWETLLSDIEKATSKRGMKTALAEHLGVQRQRVTAWLKKKGSPDPDTTLRLLRWLQHNK